MKESYIKKLYSNRLRNDNLKVVKKKKDSLEKELEYLDFSLEQPDAMPDFFIVDTLCKEASKWENRGYTNRNELDFNACAANYLDSFFGVSHIDTTSEVCATSGTTNAIAMLALAFINKGDGAVITKPSVTSLECMVRWLDGEVIQLPLNWKNRFLPRYEEIPQKALKKAKLLYINYPNNPTGQTATPDFFKETVDFAKLNNLIVVHDAAFASLVYEDKSQLSFLSAVDAKKVGVELHSMSHGFNMAGWSAGFIAGNKNVIKAYKEIKQKGGFYEFTPSSKAAAYALLHPDISLRTADKYKKRAQMITRVLKQLGFTVKMPKAGFYIYTKVPLKAGELTFTNALDFERFLLLNGIKAKAFNDGYIRFSVTFSALGEEEEKMVTNAFYERLKDYIFEF